MMGNPSRASAMAALDVLGSARQRHGDGFDLIDGSVSRIAAARECVEQHFAAQ
jgi:hypothetical protein